MIDLKEVKDYIEETVSVIALATGMDTIIGDLEGNVLGDSSFELTKDTDRRENQYVLTESAAIRKTIKDKKVHIMDDIRTGNPACNTCINAATCQINAGIAVPMYDGKDLIGGLLIYSYNEEGQNKIRNYSQEIIAFVEKLIDIFITKAKEQHDRETISTANEQLRLIIESLDEAVVAFDEKNEIINVNSRFYRQFGIPKGSLKKAKDLNVIFNNEKLREFLDRSLEEKIPDKAAFKDRGHELITIYKPVYVDSKYKGALLYFKRGLDIYKDIATIKDNYFNVTFDDIAGVSKEMLHVKAEAKRFAKGPSNILIEGKSGTGKEMFARAIHNASLFSEGPFVPVNCAAIPENLIESELFGHKEGSFTGSMKGGKVGAFQLADGGTLFLDEIAELPLKLQPKLLRAIQEKRVQPIGSIKSVPVNIRIVAATNKNIREMVNNGEFREDLYYRINVIPLKLPELKERKSDIPILLDVFLEKFNSVLDKNIIGFDLGSKKTLMNYEWPGNVRELQNVVEYAVNSCNGKYITRENLPHNESIRISEPLLSKIQPLKEVEEYYIMEALRIYGTTAEGKAKAAKALGIGRSSLYRKLAEYGAEKLVFPGEEKTE